MKWIYRDSFTGVLRFGSNCLPLGGDIVITVLGRWPPGLVTFSHSLSVIILITKLCHRLTVFLYFVVTFSISREHLSLFRLPTNILNYYFKSYKLLLI